MKGKEDDMVTNKTLKLVFANWKKAQKKRIKASGVLGAYIGGGKPANMTMAQYKQKLATSERAWRKACKEETHTCVILQEESMKAIREGKEAMKRKKPVRSDSVGQKGTPKKTPIKNWYLEEFGYHKIKVVRGKSNGDKPKKSASHKRFFGPWSTKEQADALVWRGADFAWGKPNR